MASVNRAILLGNVGKDPEVRYTTDGTATTTVSLATTDRWKDKSGESKERTEWHRVVLWGRLAEIAGQYLRKGSAIYVEGQIQTREWEDKEGVKRYTTEIKAASMQMVGGKSEARGDNEGRQDKYEKSLSPEPSQNREPDREKASASSNNQMDAFEDDIPF